MIINIKNHEGIQVGLENKITKYNTEESFFDSIIQEAKDLKGKALRTNYKVDNLEYEIIVNKKDWKGFWNALRSIHFDENEFTEYVLYTFILAKYPNTNIGLLQGTIEIKKFQDALEEVLDFVKENDIPF